MVGGEPTVLIVDDDPAIRKVLGIGLESGGFSTITADSADSAIKILSEGIEPPGCIVLDVKMPGRSGLDILPIIRSGYPLIPVVMLTAHSDLDTGLEAMRRGAFDFAVKPIRRIELIQVLNRALEYQRILVENERLADENREYQRSLEDKVKERTEELSEAYRRLLSTNMETVRVLAETIEAKDRYTRGHCNRVRVISRSIAERAGLPAEKTEIIEYGALLHDIGKIGIPESLLLKDGTLSREEQTIFRQHTVIGWKILGSVDFFRRCLDIVRSHHERFDGMGYPDGIMGRELDEGVRIVTIADAFDAMTSDRPYRRAMPIESALGELEKMAGLQFDRHS